MTCRHPQSKVTERTHCFAGPVGPPENYDRRAHGGVRHVEECECGARRITNANGCASETTGWFRPDEGTDTP